ncbi:hypothetical protein [Lysinibacter cavernae]|uniref:hypothetical protein n=1 Tax=Lysinibacter cavernae TaxID=1640652 RepID=UPI00361382F3
MSTQVCEEVPASLIAFSTYRSETTSNSGRGSAQPAFKGNLLSAYLDVSGGRSHNDFPGDVPDGPIPDGVFSGDGFPSTDDQDRCVPHNPDVGQLP